MSRRRKPRRSPSTRWHRVTLKCHGSHESPHAAQRVATVEVRLGVDETDLPFRVRVEYGGLGEPPSETGAFRNVPGDLHNTRRFLCKRCGADLPVRDDKLAPIIASAGVSVLDIGELRSRVSKQ
jgi:hypothetical protein